MSLMLSQLIAGAISVFEDFGDMPIIIDYEDNHYQSIAYEMRREFDFKTKENNFVIADYLSQTNQLRLVK